MRDTSVIYGHPKFSGAIGGQILTRSKRCEAKGMLDAVILPKVKGKPCNFAEKWTDCFECKLKRCIYDMEVKSGPKERISQRSILPLL
jgi:hypothetical protein